MNKNLTLQRSLTSVGRNLPRNFELEVLSLVEKFSRILNNINLS